MFFRFIARGRRITRTHVHGWVRRELTTTSAAPGNKPRPKRLRYYIAAASPFMFYWWTRRTERQNAIQRLEDDVIVSPDRREVRYLIRNTRMSVHQLLELADKAIQEFSDGFAHVDAFGAFVVRVLEMDKSQKKKEWNDKHPKAQEKASDAAVDDADSEYEYIDVDDEDGEEFDKEEEEDMIESAVQNGSNSMSGESTEPEAEEGNEDEEDQDNDEDEDEDEEEEFEDNRKLDAWDVLCMYRGLTRAEQDSRGRVPLSQLLAALSILADDRRVVDLDGTASPTEDDASHVVESDRVSDDERERLRKMSPRSLLHELRLPLTKFVLAWLVAAELGGPEGLPASVHDASIELERANVKMGEMKALPPTHPLAMTLGNPFGRAASASVQQTSAKPGRLLARYNDALKSPDPFRALPRLSFSQFSFMVNALVSSGHFDADSLIKSQPVALPSTQNKVWGLIGGRPHFALRSGDELARLYFSLLYSQEETVSKDKAERGSDSGTLDCLGGISCSEFARLVVSLHHARDVRWWALVNPNQGWIARTKLRILERRLLARNEEFLQMSKKERWESLQKSPRATLHVENESEETTGAVVPSVSVSMFSDAYVEATDGLGHHEPGTPLRLR